MRLLDAAIEDMASGLTVLEQRVVVLEAERDAYRDRYTRLIQSRVEDPAEETRP